MPKEHNVLSDWVCHIGFQVGRVPTRVQAGRLGCEGGVRGVGPSQMKM